MADSARKYVIYADGACIGNPGAGGWGAVIAEPVSEYRELSGGPYARTTNNRMELQAVISGLSALKEPCTVRVVTDSQYVQRAMAQHMPLWISRGF